MDSKEWCGLHCSVPYEDYVTFCKVNNIKTYDEYKEQRKNNENVPKDEKCFYCSKNAEFKTGDSRWSTFCCENHANIEIDYLSHLELTIRTQNYDIDEYMCLEHTEWFKKSF